jgi:hypothetical protein
MRCAEHATSNKPVLLSGLAHARCQLVCLLTPREFEELIADDPDFTEFFTRIDVEEPDLETALKLLRHFVCGLGPLSTRKRGRFGRAIPLQRFDAASHYG